MKEITTETGAKIVLYSGVKELPMDRYNELKKYVLRDVGIGSDIGSTAKHFETLDMLLSGDKLHEARRQRINMHTSFFLAIEKINIKHICFAIFVNTIDDKPVITDRDEISEDELIRICRILEKTKLKQSQVEDVIDDLKKKLTPNWKSYSQSIQANQQMRTILLRSKKKSSSWLRIFKLRLKLVTLKSKLFRTTN